MTEKDLVRRFADLADDALMERIQSGELTESALALARAEAVRRGLHPSTEKPVANEEVVLAPQNFVQLSRYLKPMEAYLIEGRLKAEGIQAHLVGANTIETNPLWLNAMGGVRIFVPERQYQRANDIVTLQHDGDYALTDDAATQDEGNFSNTGKQWFGWIILVLPTVCFAVLSLYQLWKSHCEPNTYCAIQEQQQWVSEYLAKLFISAICVAPAVFCIRYLNLRFKQK